MSSHERRRALIAAPLRPNQLGDCAPPDSIARTHDHLLVAAVESYDRTGPALWSLLHRRLRNADYASRLRAPALLVPRLTRCRCPEVAHRAWRGFEPILGENSSEELFKLWLEPFDDEIGDALLVGGSARHRGYVCLPLRRVRAFVILIRHSLADAGKRVVRRDHAD